jgi:glycosyltransferase involved in cell wall biosynthesis
MFSQSDWIFYPSDAEVSSLKIRMPNKKIARIPLLVYETPDRGVAKWVDRRGLLFVGGFGHDPNCDAVKWFVSEVWPRIRAHIPSIIFTIIGSRPTEEILALGGNGVQIVADATDAELLEQYGRHRIAIVPLRYGGGIKGKVLEAFYHGVPAVGTRIGAEGIAESCGYFAIADGDDFADRVVELYSDERLWRLQQEAAWEFLSANYSALALERSLCDAIPEVVMATYDSCNRV